MFKFWKIILLLGYERGSELPHAIVLYPKINANRCRSAFAFNLKVLVYNSVKTNIFFQEYHL